MFINIYLSADAVDKAVTRKVPGVRDTRSCSGPAAPGAGPRVPAAGTARGGRGCWFQLAVLALVPFFTFTPQALEII